MKVPPKSPPKAPPKIGTVSPSRRKPVASSKVRKRSPIAAKAKGKGGAVAYVQEEIVQEDEDDDDDDCVDEDFDTRPDTPRPETPLLETPLKTPAKRKAEAAKDGKLCTVLDKKVKN